MTVRTTDPMAATTGTPASAPFELRSASLTLEAVSLRTRDLGVLKGALEAQLGATPGAFDGEPVLVDLGPVGGDVPPLDLAALVALLRAHRMQPVAVRGGTPADRAAARALGLVEAPESSGAREPRTVVREVVREVRVEVPIEVPVEVPTMVIDRPLRSGQQVYAKGGDLIVLAAVNFGAEVIADGHVHVYAPLRGKAIAGARGNTRARIFSTCLEPELVAIAGTYRTTETPLPAEVLGRPAQIRLEGDRLVFQPV
jgi:septum site-determining protein MinC